jgi:hypothetical protein
MGWSFSIIVLLMLYFIIKILKNPINLIFTGKKVTGIVVGVKKNDSTISPVVQFTTAVGKQIKVSSRTSSASAGVSIGENVKLFYDLKNPQNAQLLMWREFYIIGFLLGFTALIVLFWICGFLVAPDSGFDDPLHILSSSIGYYHTSPWRLPVFFILFCTISFTGIGAHITFKNALELTNKGIKVPGLVIGAQWTKLRTQNGSVYAPAEFPAISYMDLSGKKYTIQSSKTTKLFSLKKGIRVEVIYPPNHPNLGVVNTWDEIYLTSFVFAIFFIAFSSCLILLLAGKIQLPLTQS